MSTLSDRLANLLKRPELAQSSPEVDIKSSPSIPFASTTESLINHIPALSLEVVQPAETSKPNGNDSNKQTKENAQNNDSESTFVEQSRGDREDNISTQGSETIEIPQAGQGTIIPEKSDVGYKGSLSFTEKIFSPLRYPERLIIIDDELKLRTYIAEEISLLDDNQLRQKIAVYQKLGVLIRVCESELHKIGIKRNRKFLDDNEEKSFVKLIADQPEIKERTAKISQREKWVKRMTGLGLSVAKAESLWLEKEKGKD